MKKIIPISTCLSFLLFTLSIFNCTSEPVMDGESQLFKDYSAMESKLSSIRSYPNDALTAALNEYQENYGWNYDLSDIPDGIYETYSVPDKYVYVHYLRFEIENIRYKDVYYNEYLQKDIYTDHFTKGGEQGKRHDESYYGQMVSYGNDVKLWDAYPVMEQELLDTQNPVEIDGVTGASLAVNRFRLLIMKALYEYRNNVIINDKQYSLPE